MRQCVVLGLGKKLGYPVLVPKLVPVGPRPDPKSRSQLRLGPGLDPDFLDLVPGTGGYRDHDQFWVK
ncbi:hypothetical protein V6N12_032033 [Hibiscus sabdariffa]|uniref:Uncharacterized protein n=1 Tax=Hibiscus sabdariffa TaxID=183260 RepID=A0ABR2BYV9_9ROSI